MSHYTEQDSKEVRAEVARAANKYGRGPTGVTEKQWREFKAAGADMSQYRIWYEILAEARQKEIEEIRKRNKERRR